MTSHIGMSLFRERPTSHWHDQYTIDSCTRLTLPNLTGNLGDIILEWLITLFNVEPVGTKVKIF
jgi:hypothetical protein